MNERFDDLMFRHLTGGLRADEKEQLASMLDEDPAARRELVQFVQEQTDLMECVAVKCAMPAKR